MKKIKNRIIGFLLVLISSLSALFCVNIAIDSEENFQSQNAYAATGDIKTDGTLNYTELSDGTYSVRAKEKGDLGDIVIPSTYGDKSVTEIGDNAFWKCKATSITIPKSIIKFGSNSFTMRSFPKDVFYEGDLAGWLSIEATVEKNRTSGPLMDGANLYINGELVTEIEIPDTITQIGVGHIAFSYCDNLTNITIQNSVTEIGYNAFRKCRYLKNVTIPNSVVSIYDYAFLDCFRLETIIYTGTSAQWAEVSKGEKAIPVSVTIVCDQD